MRVSPHETLRWKVKSSDLEKRYYVDALSYGANGKCTCRGFACHFEKRLQNGEKPSDSLRCKHIHQCRSTVADWLTRRLGEAGIVDVEMSGAITNLQTGACNCGAEGCVHLKNLRSYITDRYLQAHLKEHGNIEGQ